MLKGALRRQAGSLRGLPFPSFQGASKLHTRHRDSWLNDNGHEDSWRENIPESVIWKLPPTAPPPFIVGEALKLHNIGRSDSVNKFAHAFLIKEGVKVTMHTASRHCYRLNEARYIKMAGPSAHAFAEWAVRMYAARNEEPLWWTSFVLHNKNKPVVVNAARSRLTKAMNAALRRCGYDNCGRLLGDTAAAAGQARPGVARLYGTARVHCLEALPLLHDIEFENLVQELAKGVRILENQLGQDENGQPVNRKPVEGKPLKGKPARGKPAKVPNNPPGNEHDEWSADVLAENESMKKLLDAANRAKSAKRAGRARRPDSGRGTDGWDGGW